MSKCIPAFALFCLNVSSAVAQQPGDLDPSFGVGGIVITDFRRAIDRAFDVVLQPDGKIVAVGSSYAKVVGPDQSFLIARLKPDGTLDSTFNDDGLASTVVGFGYSEARAVALQPDGKIVAAGISLGQSYGDLTLVRYHPDGSLDTSFGNGGISTLELGFVEEAWDVALQPDGRIVVVGTYRAVALAIEDFLVVRYESDGTVDSTFGTNGVVFTDFVADQAYAVQIQPDARIVVGGIAIGPGLMTRLAMARYLPDGSLDLSFNGTGKVLSAASLMGVAHALALQPDGKIGAAGYVYDSNQASFNFAIARFHADGTADSSFASDGFATTNVQTNFDAPMDLVIQPDGRMVIAGTTGWGNDFDFAVLRYSTSGVLDSTFGSNGIVTTTFGPNTDWGYGVVLDTNAHILVAGAALVRQYDDMAFARYKPDGELDSTFSDDGMALVGIHSVDSAFAMAIRPNDRVLAGGTSDSNFALAQYTKKGVEDSTFSSDGLVTNDFNGGIDAVHDIVLSIDDKATLSGIADNGPASKFALARYNIFGFLDNSLSLDGKLTTSIGTLSAARAITLQPNGRILAAGMTFTTKKDFAAARYTSTGAADNSFDFDGKVITAVTPEYNEAYDMLIQPDGKIVVVGVTLGSFALVRYNANGSLDNSFGSGGKVITPIGSGDTAYATALQPDARILVAGVSDGKFAIARYNANGSFDTSFSSDGIVTTIIGNYAEARGVALMADGRIVLAGTSDHRFAVARYESNGDLDTTFSQDGITTVPIGLRASGRAVALQNDERIVVAGESMGDFALIRLYGMPCASTSGTAALSGCTPFTSPSGHHTWTLSGTYLDTIFNESGCDSFLTVNLTIVHPDTTVSVSGFVMTANATAATYQWINCANNWWVPGATQQSFHVTTAGSYAVIITQQGCGDTSNCRFFCNSFSTLSVTACNTYTSPSGNYTWTGSGTYHDTISNAISCDSFITIQLSIVAPPDTTVTISGTHTLSAQATGVSYQWIDCDNGNAIAGATLSSFTPGDSGSYAVIVTNAGCSDTSSCRFIIPPCGSTANLTVNECFVYVSPSGHHTWTTSGLYYDTISNAAGCDSIMAVHLTIRWLDTSVVVSGDSLTAVEPGAQYEWIDCTTLLPVTGATQQTFVPAHTGSYAVIVNKNGCSDTSECRYVELVGIMDAITGRVILFPNPTSGVVTIRGTGLSKLSVEVSDLTGRVLRTLNGQIPLTFSIGGPAGVYVITIRHADESVQSLKLIKF